MPAPRTTVKFIRSHIEAGRGMGHHEAYRAFILSHRWTASPASVRT